MTSDVQEEPKRLRLIFVSGWEPVDFEKSTCDRTLYGDTLWEYIQIYGNLDQLAEGELEKWIDSFRVKVHEHSNAFVS